MRVGIRAKPHEIQKARLEKGLSQGAAAAEIKITGTHLSTIESGKRGISPVLAKKVCQLLEKRFSEIFEVIKLTEADTWKEGETLVKWICPYCGNAMYSANDSHKEETVCCIKCSRMFPNEYFSRREDIYFSRREDEYFSKKEEKS
ncbi:MAG: hypothetical protein DDT21_02749 [Syntrophomonadaceae bacterium]|nr:hypothetical protein [Bacillota bacterium]